MLCVSADVDTARHGRAFFACAATALHIPTIDCVTAVAAYHQDQAGKSHVDQHRHALTCMACVANSLEFDRNTLHGTPLYALYLEVSSRCS